MLAVIAAALWPSWLWYLRRVTDGSDEPLGVLALITFVAIAVWKQRNPDQAKKKRRQTAVESKDCPNPDQSSVPVGIRSIWLKAGGSISAILILYCFCLILAPPMVSALFAVGTILFWLNRNGLVRSSASDWFLVFLSMPLVASLNFYAGYPLRWLVSRCAATLLTINGFPSVVQGTSILWHSYSVDIDAPCSGIKMLWMAMYITAAIASIRQLSLAQTLSLMVLSVIAALFANILRVTSLFYLETGTVNFGGSLHDIVHQGTGVAVFLLLAAGLMSAAFYLWREKQSDANSDPKVESAPQENNSASLANSFLALNHKRVDGLSPTFLFLCVLVSILPVFANVAPSAQEDHFPGWPSTFENLPLQSKALSPDTEEFAKEFPGRIGVFTNGKRIVVFRWLTQPTRKLHPSCDCYRSMGYAIKWLPTATDTSGIKWSRFEGTKGDSTVQVRERIFDNVGHAWTDVSEWYWSAILQRTRAPWWSVTVAQ
jgi:exosortase/archaeosortase family protein